MKTVFFAWLRRAAVFSLLPLVAVPSSFGWGSDGHRMINKLAALHLPQDIPAFLRTPEAVSEFEYLGPEPDRWRGKGEPELSATQAPDHFIDMEYADMIGTLPRKRYDYIAMLYALQPKHPEVDLHPEKVGFQPYQTVEVWERLKSAMRDYRYLSDKKADTKPVEQAILFYAAWLGHYVGDGSQPLHCTVNYDGWITRDNPNDYTRNRGIHSKFESKFVSENIRQSDVEPKMTPLHPYSDIFNDYMAYLHRTASQIEPVYKLDKIHGFEGAGTGQSRDFVAARIAAGASMLRDLIYAAWVESGKPAPDYRPGY